jgi:hypothetical protein
MMWDDVATLNPICFFFSNVSFFLYEPDLAFLLCVPMHASAMSLLTLLLIVVFVFRALVECNGFCYEHSSQLGEVASNLNMTVTNVPFLLSGVLQLDIYLLWMIPRGCIRSS